MIVDFYLAFYLGTCIFTHEKNYKNLQVIQKKISFQAKI